MAGYLAAHFATKKEELVDDYATHSILKANYSLGQKYGGKSNSIIKSYGPNICGPHKKGGRRLSSAWIREAKGCFLRGRNHKSNEKQP